jgi:orotate phosphoribosyltransferase
MSKLDTEIIEIFKDSGALLEGHFILRSGLRSGHFFQCAQVCQYLDKVTRLAEILVGSLKSYGATTVVGNAMGGLVIGQEVARQMDLRYVFLEKVNDQLALRRNFKFKPDEKVLIIEDVITKGGRVFEAIKELKAQGANPVAVGVIVDRSNGSTSFEIPHHSLANLNFPTYDPENLPAALEKITATKPGS